MINIGSCGEVRAPSEWENVGDSKKGRRFVAEAEKVILVFLLHLPSSSGKIDGAHSAATFVFMPS